MRNIKRTFASTALLMTFLTLGIFGAMPQAAQADDVPIIVGKPIIKPDPPKPPKKDGEVTAAIGPQFRGSQK